MNKLKAKALCVEMTFCSGGSGGVILHAFFGSIVL